MKHFKIKIISWGWKRYFRSIDYPTHLGTALIDSERCLSTVLKKDLHGKIEKRLVQKNWRKDLHGEFEKRPAQRNMRISSSIKVSNVNRMRRCYFLSQNKCFISSITSTLDSAHVAKSPFLTVRSLRRFVKVSRVGEMLVAVTLACFTVGF